MTTLRIGRLACTLDDDGGVTLVGRLDDTAPLAELIARLPASGVITIDTAGVTFVNSIGMREWMRLVRAIHGRGQRLTFIRVADVLITQMNMIPGFKGTASIASFHAQYVCLACGDETVPLIDAVTHAAALGALTLPVVPCGICGGTTELGDFPERYATLFAR